MPVLANFMMVARGMMRAFPLYQTDRDDHGPFRIGSSTKDCREMI